MKSSAERNWISLALIAALLPMSLLATFRLTGVLPEPQTPETITVEAVSWEIDRPLSSLSYRENAENAYMDEAALIELKVYFDYDRATESRPDELELYLRIAANLSGGFLHSMVVRFSRTDPDSILFISQDGLIWPSRFRKISNLEVERIVYHSTKDQEAYVLLKGQNNPEHYMLELTAKWGFYTTDPPPAWITVTLETTYYNGTAYRRIIIPIKIGILPDIGDTFETAKPVVPGTHKGCLDGVDIYDVFSIYLEENQTIDITMIPPEDANYDLILYNPNEEEVASSRQSRNATETITYTATYSGPWYIRVENVCPPGVEGNGIYYLRIE